MKTKEYIKQLKSQRDELSSNAVIKDDVINEVNSELRLIQDLLAAVNDDRLELDPTGFFYFINSLEQKLKSII